MPRPVNYDKLPTEKQNPRTTRLDTFGVEKILSRMDEGCRRLLERVFLEGASYTELAGELEIVESSVRAKLARCVRRARELSS